MGAATHLRAAYNYKLHQPTPRLDNTKGTCVVHFTQHRTRQRHVGHLLKTVALAPRLATAPQRGRQLARRLHVVNRHKDLQAGEGR